MYDAIIVDAIPTGGSAEGAHLCCIRSSCVCKRSKNRKKKKKKLIDIDSRVAKCNFRCRHVLFSFSRAHCMCCSNTCASYGSRSFVCVCFVVFYFTSKKCISLEVHDRMQPNALLYLIWKTKLWQRAFGSRQIDSRRRKHFRALHSLQLHIVKKTRFFFFSFHFVSILVLVPAGSCRRNNYSNVTCRCRDASHSAIYLFACIAHLLSVYG